MTHLLIHESEIVQTQHPRELAEETLRNLLEFSKFLEEISIRSANLINEANFYDNFTKLIDGINTFTEAIMGVKKILRIGILQSVSILEADLLSILQDLLMSQTTQNKAYAAELLREHLPGNLQQWRDVGIQALIRARDN